MGNFTGKDDSTPAYGYGVIPITLPLGIWEAEFVFYKRIKGQTDVITLGRYFTSEILGWHHFDITRNTDEEFNVFINESHVKSFQDDTYTTSEVFRFSGGPGSGIDSIVIQDEIVVTPPQSTNGGSSSSSNASFEVLAVSLLLLVLFKRKTKKSHFSRSKSEL
ncbi:MAG: hypothetical protein ACFFDT_27110 [Candidatus Hodarchaeota archaeon]